jgi:hypothetical protein
MSFNNKSIPRSYSVIYRQLFIVVSSSNNNIMNNFIKIFLKNVKQNISKHSTSTKWIHYKKLLSTKIHQKPIYQSCLFGFNSEEGVHFFFSSYHLFENQKQKLTFSFSSDRTALYLIFKSHYEPSKIRAPTSW